MVFARGSILKLCGNARRFLSAALCEGSDLAIVCVIGPFPKLISRPAVYGRS
jgi:hypothetical protein